MESEQIIGIIMIVVSAMTVICLRIWYKSNEIKQRMTIRGFNYREVHSELDEYAYKNALISITVEKLQKNSGEDPKKFRRKVRFVNNFEEEICGIIKIGN